MKSKRWISVLVCMLLCIGMLPVTAFAADYNVTVNGVAITQSNAADVLGDGTVSYEDTTNTLILDGASLTQIQNNTGEPFTIKASGTNTVAITSGTTNLIESNAPLTITGDAQATLTLSGVNPNSYISCIKAQGSVTVEIITLVLTNSSNAGILTTGDITVQKGATVKGDTGYMFYATASGAGKLTVTDSTVIAPLDGTSVSGWMSAWVNEMAFSNATVDIVAPNGIYATGDIVIYNQSDVKVTADGTATPYPAIFAGGSMTITDSEVEAESNTYSGLYAVKDLTITGGRIKAVTKSSEHPAMRAKENLTINGAVTIETETNSGVSYAGNVNFAIKTPVEPTDAMYEVYAGASAEDAAEITGSPFAANTDVTAYVEDSLYFTITAHTHTGGKATCSSGAICTGCNNEYGATDPENHTNLERVEASPATHLKEGNPLYYYCDGCDQYFSDEAGTAEIPLADTIIPKLTEHSADGAGWQADENNHWNTCECGEKLNQAAHTFAWVTDKKATATEAGAHHQECTICGYKKGAVEIPAMGTTPTSDGKTVPDTGDSNLTQWIALLLLACGGVMGVIAYAKKRNAA